MAIRLVFVFTFCITLFICLLSTHKVFAFANDIFSPNNTFAPVAPYATIQTGKGNISTEGNEDFISISHTYRIRQNGMIEQIRFYTDDISTTTNFKITIWRKTEGTFSLIDTSDNLVDQLKSNTINTVSL